MRLFFYEAVKIGRFIIISIVIIMALLFLKLKGTLMIKR